jgi:hypothetical protein
MPVRIMEPVAAAIESVLARYEAGFRSYGVRVELAGVSDGEATVAVDTTDAVESCSGGCEFPLPALVAALERELKGLAGVRRLRWSTEGAAR